MVVESRGSCCHGVVLIFMGILIFSQRSMKTVCDPPPPHPNSQTPKSHSSELWGTAGTRAGIPALGSGCTQGGRRISKPRAAPFPQHQKGGRENHPTKTKLVFQTPLRAEDRFSSVVTGWPPSKLLCSTTRKRRYQDTHFLTRRSSREHRGLGVHAKVPGGRVPPQQAGVQEKRFEI